MSPTKELEAVMYAAARRTGSSEVEAEALVRRHRESEAQKSAKAKAIIAASIAAEAEAFRGELDRVTAEREQREQQGQRGAGTEPRDLTHYDQAPDVEAAVAPCTCHCHDKS
jgi:hypothetical protein